MCLGTSFDSTTGVGLVFDKLSSGSCSSVVLSLKEPRLSPGTPHPSKSLLGKYSKKTFIKANTYLKNNDYFMYLNKTQTHIHTRCRAALQAVTDLHNRLVPSKAHPLN